MKMKNRGWPHKVEKVGQYIDR